MLPNEQRIFLMNAVWIVLIALLPSHGYCLDEANSDRKIPHRTGFKKHEGTIRKGLKELQDFKKEALSNEFRRELTTASDAPGISRTRLDSFKTTSEGKAENSRAAFDSKVLPENGENRDYMSRYSKKLLRNEDLDAQQPTGRVLERPNRALKTGQSTNKLEQVTIEVERLFDSLNKRRSEIEQPRKGINENEITVVIENDDEGDDDYDGAAPFSKKNDIPDENESGFAIILDNTNGKEEISTPGTTAKEFAKMSRSYNKMKSKFDTFLSEETNHIPRVSPSISSQRPTTEGGLKQTRTNIVTPSKPTPRRLILARSTIEANIEKLKKLKERLEFESAAIDFEDGKSAKKLRSETSGNQTSKELTHFSDGDSNENKETRRGKISELDGKRKADDEESKTDVKKLHHYDDSKKSGLDASEDHQKNEMTGTETSIRSRLAPTESRQRGSHKVSLRPGKRYFPTHAATLAARTVPLATTNVTIGSTNNPGGKVIHPRKASAMIEYLNKDPLESWFYKFQSLSALGLNSTMLRNGLVNAGSIDRLKNVMVRALRGEDIVLSVVGGSISAGGGLYKDEGNIGGLYYKGVVDWWNKVITPLTGSEMRVNNIAIGSIGTDYFSYCLRSHISNESNIIIWELSGNDYNRYLKTPTKGAKPLERLTRMALQIQSDPAILFVNFFKGVDYKKTKKNCPNFEDQGEDIIAHYYKVPSLSWRAMVCESLIDQRPLFTLKTLFCKDQYHPSLLAHAQTALLLILHLRHVMRSVLQYASSHEGVLPNFDSFYSLPAPLFVGLEHPVPLCWTLISPDFKESLTNNLDVKILIQNGFKIEYATNFPIRFDRVICWKAEKVGAVMKIQITLPEAQKKDGQVEDQMKGTRYEIAVTTHTRFGGSAEVWLDQRPGQPIVLHEGRPNDTGKRTQVDVITQDAEPGVHTVNLKAISTGFCLASIMVS